MKLLNRIIVMLALLSSRTHALSSDEELELINLNTEEASVHNYTVTNDKAIGRHSIEFSYSLPTSPLRVSRLSGLNIRYSTHAQSYGLTFIGSTSNISISEATSLTGNFDADEETLSTIELGFGFNRTSILPREILSSKSFTDELSAAIVYGQVSSDVLINDLAGFGLVTSYALKRKLNDSWSFIGRIDHHLHSLEDTTSNPEIEVTASWMSLTLGLGISF